MFGTITVARLGARAIAALRQPCVSATLLIMLLMDACTLPASTTIGGFIIKPRHRCCGCSWPEGVVMQCEQGLRLVDYDSEAARNIDERSIIATLYCNPRRRTCGFWAATREWWDPTIRVLPWSRNLSVAELASLRSPFADIVEAGDWSILDTYADLVRAGAGPRSRTIWSGYVHNAISLMLATLSMLSLGWIRDRMRARHARWAMQAGLCPSCRYDLRGELSAGCPECGWRRDGA